MIVAAVIAIVAIASLGCIFVPGISVHEWDSVNAGITVIFVMDVQNDNPVFERTATVHCEVRSASGNIYTATRNVTLGPGEAVSRLTIPVAVPLADMSVETATKVYVR